MKTILKSLALLSSTALGSLVLSGCEPVLFVGTGAAVTTSVAEERGIGGVFSDSSIKTRINMLYMEHSAALLKHVDIVVRQGRVLLTGVVPTPQVQIDAVRLAWKVDGVQEVIDETTVGEGGGFGGYSSDSWITTQLKSKLLFDGDISSINYNIQTIKGTVYLMGVAQDQKELDKVIDIARRTSRVKNVVSYVRIKPQYLTAPYSSSQPTQGDMMSQGGQSQQPSTIRQPSTPSPMTNAPSAPMGSSGGIEMQSLDAPNTGSSFQ